MKAGRGPGPAASPPRKLYTSRALLWGVLEKEKTRGRRAVLVLRTVLNLQEKHFALDVGTSINVRE